MQSLDRKQVIILLLVVMLSLLISICGYCRWVRPLRGYVSVHLHPLAQKKEPFVLDERAELQRWSSLRGGLLSWQRKQQAVQFRWLGSYMEMLQVLRDWPQVLVIKHMHWQRGKNGGVQWSGEYALAD